MRRFLQNFLLSFLVLTERTALLWHVSFEMCNLVQSFKAVFNKRKSRMTLSPYLCEIHFLLWHAQENLKIMWEQRWSNAQQHQLMVLSHALNYFSSLLPNRGKYNCSKIYLCTCGHSLRGSHNTFILINWSLVGNNLRNRLIHSH